MTPGRSAVLAVAILVVGQVGCYRDNQDYNSDGGVACASATDCVGTPGQPVCDVGGTMTCVQCTVAEAGQCKDKSPVCGGDHTCRGCTAHTECGSGACLPDGSCATETNVAYVAPAPTGSNNTMCSKATPCVAVAKALETGRPYVKLSGTTDEQVAVNNQPVTLLADPGAKLLSMKPGIVLEVKGTSQLEIYDLEITGGLGAGGIGISLPPGSSALLKLVRAKVTGNTGGGIVSSGGTLTVAQSTVSGNTAGGISVTGGTLTVTQSTVSGNTAGGISATGGSFHITNSIIVKNGGTMSAFGGVLISQITTMGNVFEFNTVSANAGAMGATTGVQCAANVAELSLSNSIVYGNQVSGVGTQVSGPNCNWTYSDIGPDTVAGMGNLNADPGFVDAPGNNFHLKATSAARDKANPAATLTVDFDGDARPQGAQRDLGADEIKP